MLLATLKSRARGLLVRKTGKFARGRIKEMGDWSSAGSCMLRFKRYGKYDMRAIKKKGTYPRNVIGGNGI